MGSKTKIDWCDSTWVKIPEYEDYYVSNDGRILSEKKRTPHIMNPITSKDGHMYVFLYKNGNMKKEWIHRIVLSAWDRLPEDGEVGRHLNDNPSDNRICNLAWGTYEDNSNDRRKNKGFLNGEKCYSHKLNESQVMEIRERYADGESSADLCGEYGVARNTIIAIARGDKWKHLPTIPVRVKHISRRKTPLSPEEIAIGTENLNRYSASIKKERVKVPCACGCGETLETPDSKGRGRKYIHGHNTRRAKQYD